MNQIKKRLGGLLLSAAVLLSLPLPVFAADDYTVKVSGSTVAFLVDDAVVGSYPAASSDIILTSDRSGDLLVQFPNKTGTYTNVTLGQQLSVTLTGSMRSLSLRSDLYDDLFVELDEDAKVTDLKVYNQSDVTVFGKVSLAEVYSAGSLNVPESGSITRARLRSPSASIQAAGEVAAVEKVSGAISTGRGIAKTSAILGSSANKAAYSKSGLQIDNRSDPVRRSTTGGTSTTTSSGLTVKTGTIYAEYGDLLEDLQSELERVVRVYNKSGSRIYGEVNWGVDDATKVRGNGYHRFVFWPDDSRYNKVAGRVYVVTDDRYYDRYDDDYYYDRYYDRYDDDYYDDDYYGRAAVYFETEPIYTQDEYDLRLRDLESELEGSVIAYSRSNDSELSGEFEWVTPSTRVRGNTTYQFRFIPDSSRYRKTTGRVRIYVE